MANVSFLIPRMRNQQGKSEGFDSCDRPSNLTQIGFQSSNNQPVWPWNLTNGLEKQLDTFPILHQVLCSISNPSVNLNWSYSLETLNWVKIGDSLSRVTLKFDRCWKTIGHLFYTTLTKLCAIFQSHFLSRMTMKIYRWLWKTTGHLFDNTSGFVHHLKSIGEVIL